MLAIDLMAAGIAPETESGAVEFHALRGAYITHLVSSGASVKTRQPWPAIRLRFSGSWLVVG